MSDDVSQRITRAIGNFPDDANVSHVLRDPSDRIARALGIDPDMTVETLQRRLLYGSRVEQIVGWHGVDGATDVGWLVREET